MTLLLGGGGQLGRELRKIAPDDAAIEAPSSIELSVTDRSGLIRAAQSVNPMVVINAAAYTAVDDAESDREAAFAVNAQGARAVAEAARAVRARLIHVSTDFVFAGDQSLPYLPTDPTGPLGVYGESKLAGERAVLETNPDHSLVVRTSWLYSAHRRNFVGTMLRLLAERSEIQVVVDQVGSPTWARSLARAIWKWSALPAASGLRHYSDAGVASWFDFAMAIREEGSNLGLLRGNISDTQIRPIRTKDFPTPARRPALSVLDSFASWDELGFTPLHWRDSLRLMLSEMAGSDRRRPADE
ncbi:MAG: dTDP-4-dehydrorhamnose reductase [Thermoanaerobaculia bacterium]